MEQVADFAPIVQIIDILVQLLVDQLMEILKNDVEQVIEVPKSEPQQLVEQLVEVPVPESVVLAHGRDAAGIEWCQIAARRSTGGWCARATPSGTSWRDSPPAQGGKQTLGAATVPQIQQPIVDKAVDVPVTMLHKF